MRKALILLAGLALAGCSLPAVSGTMYFADGSKAADYSAKTVETSIFNASTVVVTRPAAGASADVKTGTSIGNATEGLAQSVAQGMGFFIPFCAAGNC